MIMIIMPYRRQRWRRAFPEVIHLHHCLLQYRAGYCVFKTSTNSRNVHVFPQARPLFLLWLACFLLLPLHIRATTGTLPRDRLRSNQFPVNGLVRTGTRPYRRWIATGFKMCHSHLSPFPALFLCFALLGVAIESASVLLVHLTHNSCWCWCSCSL